MRGKGKPHLFSNVVAFFPIGENFVSDFPDAVVGFIVDVFDCFVGGTLSDMFV